MSSTFLIEINTVVPAPRLFRAAIIDGGNVLPKILSDKIVSAETVEGDGGIGSVRQVVFRPGMPFSDEKRRLDFEDVDNCEIKSSLVGGGGLGVVFESASFHVKIEPSGTGSLVKIVLTYTPVPGVNTEELTKRVKGGFIGIFKGTEAFLLANPDAYN